MATTAVWPENTRSNKLRHRAPGPGVSGSEGHEEGVAQNPGAGGHRGGPAQCAAPRSSMRVDAEWDRAYVLRNTIPPGWRRRGLNLMYVKITTAQARKERAEPAASTTKRGSAMCAEGAGSPVALRFARPRFRKLK